MGVHAQSKDESALSRAVQRTAITQRFSLAFPSFLPDNDATAVDSKFHFFSPDFPSLLFPRAHLNARAAGRKISTTKQPRIQFHLRKVRLEFSPLLGLEPNVCNPCLFVCLSVCLLLRWREKIKMMAATQTRARVSTRGHFSLSERVTL